MMKGLELSRRYYETCGKPMLEKDFPQLKNRIAAGLVGYGSECYGYDDALSGDHDYGPSFCLWLTVQDMEKYGKDLQEAYDKLPKEFLGVAPRNVTKQGNGRVGVLAIDDFYQEILGVDPFAAAGMQENTEAGKTAVRVITEADWLQMPEEALAAATNGCVYEDALGEFTARRKLLLSYYPEPVWRKKLAQCAALMAQSGQYNYARAMRRGEYIAAELALSEFIKQSMQMVYLLNRRFAPFYKWMHHGMKELTRLSEVGEMLMLLTDITDSKQKWQTEEMDGKIIVIEAVCQVIIQELQAQGLTDSEDGYLETHAHRILENTGYKE